jgi:hypothetical protein
MGVVCPLDWTFPQRRIRYNPFLSSFIPRHKLPMIRNALIRLLGGHLDPPDHGEPRAEIVALEARVRALEDVQLKRELEWAEVSEKLLRYIKRISAVDERARQREEQNSPQSTDPVTLALLRSKYPQSSGG